jgi:transcriptional regulator with XRE-family HTH domain
MKATWTKNMLSNNLKYFRGEAGLSQSELAKKARISLRLVQDIESGRANPTMDSLGNLATAFSVTIEALLRLSQLRLLEGDEGFFDRYTHTFKKSNIGVGIRNLSGVALWANDALSKIHGSLVGKGPFNLLDSYSNETRGVIKNQLSAEKNGFCYPYTISHINSNSNETMFLRCYPTLIMPTKGKIPVYTSVYLAEMRDDCALNYFNYCSHLLDVAYDKKRSLKFQNSPP